MPKANCSTEIAQLPPGPSRWSVLQLPLGVPTPANRRLRSVMLRLRQMTAEIAEGAEREGLVAGFRIPKGAFITISPWIIHRRAEDWPEPERFDPERFIGSSPLKARRGYLPFGAGRRYCPGRAFAMLELRMALAAVLEQWCLRPLGPLSAPLPRATLRTATPIRLQLDRR